MADFDCERINQILSSLVGVRCWEAYLGYGDELHLNMGDKIHYTYTRIPDLVLGSWRLGMRASFWILRHSANSITAWDKEPDQIEIGLQALANRTISRASLDTQSLVLTIQFDGDYQLEVTPDTEDVQEDDICDWELFTPDHMYLGVGPGRKWVYRDSRTPE